MSALELKIPPPAVAAAVAFLMWLAARVVPSTTLPAAARVATAVALAVAGGLLGAAGLYSFFRAQTTFEPLEPDKTTSLVVTGVYRVTRNPMYLGLMLLLLAWAAYLANGGALVVSALFVVYIDRFQIRPEERTLAELFGADYDGYRKRVRRWL